MIEAHYNAVKACIEAGAGLAGKVFPSARLDKDNSLVREAYVILYPTAPLELRGRFSETADALADATFLFDVRAVAVAPIMAGRTLDAVLGQTVGARLQMAGRKLNAIRLDSVSRVEPDATVTPPLFYADARLELVSRR